MNIEELTIKEAREIASLVQGSSPSDHPYQIGNNYLIRTVTMIQCGRLVRVTQQELVLENASWVADTGRFQQALETGNFSEVEMFPQNNQVIIGRGAVVDATVICKIPTSQK